MKKIIFLIIFLLLSSLLSDTVISDEKSKIYKYKDDPKRYEEAIREFDFAGSSSIKLWKTLAEDFIPFNVINRGFGGSQTSDLLYYADRIIIPYKPGIVVVYESDNDISAGKTSEMVYDDFKLLVKKIHESLPETVIMYITIKPSIRRWALWDKMDKANKLVKIFSLNNALVEHIDIGPPMIGRYGTPGPDLFLENGLHLNEKGYKLWTSIVKPYILRQVVKEK